MESKRAAVSCEAEIWGLWTVCSCVLLVGCLVNWLAAYICLLTCIHAKKENVRDCCRFTYLLLAPSTTPLLRCTTEYHTNIVVYPYAPKFYLKFSIQHNHTHKSHEQSSLSLSYSLTGLMNSKVLLYCLQIFVLHCLKYWMSKSLRKVCSAMLI